MGIGDGGRLQEILFGDFQHRFDLRLDAGFAGNVIGRFQQFRNLIDISADEARQGALGIGLWQMD
ncbi:hypothetical protein D3C79_789910 [compost metagenome]